MSYRNPSKINSNSSTSGGYSDAIAMAIREDEIQEARTKANISSLVQGSLDAILAKQEGLNNLNKKVTKADLNMYNRVESDGFKTGFNSFDKKAEDLMFNSITKFNKIKSSIENGTSDDLELSKQGLASINSMIDQYGDAVPNILAVNEAINKQSSSAELDEQFSVTGAPAHQLAIISKLSQGSDDIDIIEENDNIILIDNNPGKWYNEDENGNLIEGKGPTKLNLFEFNRNLLNKNNPYLKYKADPTQVESSAWSELVKQESGYNPNYVTDEDGKYRMTVDQQKAFKEKVAGLATYKKNDKGFYTYLPGDNNNEYNGFSTLLRKRGESIWEDEGNMQTLVKEKGLKSQWPKVIPQPGTKEFNEFVDGQYIPALKWLAEETLRKNSQDITLDQPGDVVSSNDTKTTSIKEDKNKSTYKTQEEFNNAWNNANPGDKLIGLDGKQYTKPGLKDDGQTRSFNVMEREALNKK
jgi:hypothetical protein